MMWSLSNAFTSAFNELDPILQYKATAKLAGFLQAVRPVMIFFMIGFMSLPACVVGITPGNQELTDCPICQELAQSISMA